MGSGKEILEYAKRADAEAARKGAQRALQAHLDAVADALGAELMARFDGYHGECVKRLMEVANASARYVASHRLQAVRLQGAEDKSEYVAAAKALDEALVELHGASEKR